MLCSQQESLPILVYLYVTCSKDYAKHILYWPHALLHFQTRTPVLREEAGLHTLILLIEVLV